MAGLKILNKSIIFLFLLTFASCSTGKAVVDNTVPPEKTIPANTAIPPVTETIFVPPPQDDYVAIIAAGDNLYHEVMIRSGESGDYKSAYSEIQTLTKSADIAFINQETLLAGKDFGFSGYPQFNSPQALGRSIAEVGFNVVNHANNHAMDKGEKALLATMDFWDAYPDVTVLGIHRSEEQRKEPALVKKNNITVGFLSYTYGTNGIPLPAGKPYLVSLINTEKMKEEITALRPLCDFLAVSMHWGEEYQHNYNKTQKDLAVLLASLGVDLVIGHHPHVIQAVEYIPRPDGGQMLCFFSIGNFISAQREIPAFLGAMAYIKIRKTAAEKAEPKITAIADYGIIPVITHYENGFTGFKVYPVYSYSEELAKRHWKDGLSMLYFRNLSSKIFLDKELLVNPFED